MSRKSWKKAAITSAVLAGLIGINVYAASCVVYKVEKGDSLWKIAKNHQVALEDVISYNPQIENPDLIYPDDEIYVPVDIVDRELKEEIRTEEIGTEESPGAVDEVPESGNTNTDRGDDIITDGHEQGTAQNSDSLAELEAQVLELVNQERAAAGAAPLTLNTEAAKVARTKSKDMIDQKYFAHNSPTYGSPSQMLNTFGISYRASGENIAMGQRTAQEVMNSWMNSSGHKANILNSTFTQIGIGCAQMNNGTIYWTQVFITP